MAQPRYGIAMIKPVWSEQYSDVYIPGTAVEVEYHIFDSLKHRQAFIDSVADFKHEKYLPFFYEISPKVFEQSTKDVPGEGARPIVIVDQRSNKENTQ